MFYFSNFFQSALSHSSFKLASHYCVFVISFQSHVVVPDPSMVVRVPHQVALDAACMVPCSGITALSAVRSIVAVVNQAVTLTGQPSRSTKHNPRIRYKINYFL